MATIYVPWLNPIVKTQPLAAWELGLCVALAALVFVAVELRKPGGASACAPGHGPHHGRPAPGLVFLAGLAVVILGAELLLKS